MARDRKGVRREDNRTRYMRPAPSQTSPVGLGSGIVHMHRVDCGSSSSARLIVHGLEHAKHANFVRLPAKARGRAEQLRPCRAGGATLEPEMMDSRSCSRANLCRDGSREI